MPIKIPKGFQRRKSSGNPLEELPNPPEPSFRVFERPEGTKSFDGGNNLKRMIYGRPLSASQTGEDHLFVDGRPNINPNNRGSGGTNNSTSSRGHNDTSSSSARFSSTSTLPSSTDTPLDEKSYSMTKGPYHIPAPPVPTSHHSALKAAGRAFSFGRKKAEAVSGSPLEFRPSIEDAPSDSYAANRSRAMTDSSYASGSTATPPKLIGGNLDFDDGFGSMFEGFGKRQSRVVEPPSTLGEATTDSPENLSPAGSRMLTKSYFGERQMTPSPDQLDLSQETQPLSKSWVGKRSQEAMTQKRSDILGYDASTSPGSPSISETRQNPSHSQSMPLTESTSPSSLRRQQQASHMTGSASKNTNIYNHRSDLARNSHRIRDEEAKLVMDSITVIERLDHHSQTPDIYDDETYSPAASLIPSSSYPSSPYGAPDPQKTMSPEARQRSPAPLFDSSDQDFSAIPWRYDSAETTPKARKSEIARQEERSMFDTSPQPSGKLSQIPTSPKAQSPPKPDTHNKIMTPAQFEKYRIELETRRDQYFHKDESDDDADDYEDDDEIERSKQLAKERRKQEAHLSVYRQQMMKVTGEQPSDLPNGRPGLDRSSLSAPNLANRSETPTFSFDTPTEAGKSSGDEDEDIPLGVLAAHGFPSKNRPPTASSSHVKYKSESYPPPPLSTSGAPAASGPRSLPPFAKNLPQDPYYGAGLVNPSNREPLAFNQEAPASVAGSPRPNMTPGGLVGVIAGEERARAARRGSPNAQGNYGSPLPPGMQVGMTPGMPPLMSPGEQATVHMSEQMNQMMQMQMQWMQQMQQMMAGGVQPGIQPGQPPHFMMPQQQQMMNAGMLAPPKQPQRPISAPTTPGTPQQAQPRAMSMMGPTFAPLWQPCGNNRISQVPSMMSGALNGQGPGYTPSLAPSERSNVGMPTRYRPISIAPVDEHKPRESSRLSTFTTSNLQLSTSGRSSRMSTSADRQSKLSLRPIGQATAKKAGSDDDDEEGWEEMKQQREKKKSTWRMRRQRDEHHQLDLYDYPEQ